MVKLNQTEAQLNDETERFDWWIAAIIIIAIITLVLNQLVQFGSLNMLESNTQYLADFTQSSMKNL